MRIRFATAAFLTRPSSSPILLIVASSASALAALLTLHRLRGLSIMLTILFCCTGVKYGPSPSPEVFSGSPGVMGAIKLLSHRDRHGNNQRLAATGCDCELDIDYIIGGC
jgi:hypothetical protein